MNPRSKSASAIGDLLDDLLPAPSAGTAALPAEPDPSVTTPPPPPPGSPAEVPAVLPVAAKEARRPAATSRPSAPGAAPFEPSRALAAVDRTIDSSPMVTTTIRIRADLLERLRDYSAFSSISISKILATGATEVLDEMARRYRARGIQVPTRQALRDDEMVAPKARDR